MFKLCLNPVKLLKSIFEPISMIVDEVQIQTDSEGLRLNALDKSHISFISLNMMTSYFDEYVCEAPQKINIDTNELMKILKRGKNDDTLIMTLEENNLIITFNGTAKRTFKLRLIDLEYDNPTPPSINYDANIEAPLNFLKDSCSDISIFSDKISFTCDEDYLHITGVGDFGDAEIKYVHGEKITETTKSIFTLTKVKDMLRCDQVSEFVRLGLGTNKPLSLSFVSLSEEVKLSFLLAPRIETEE